MSAYTSGRWRRLIPVSVLLAATVASGALVAGRAGASPKVVKVKGPFTAVFTNGPGCSSPVGFCVKGDLKGSLKGTLDLTAQSTAPSGTTGLTLVISTSVLHTKDGDLFLATSTVGDLNPASAGEFSGVDVITGGTMKWAGASGYLQNRGAVENGIQKGDYQGKIVLP